MTDDEKKLLDLMLDASARSARREAPRPAHEVAEAVVGDALWPADVEQVLELTDPDLRTLLAKLAPGDLLCVVAEGSEALRSRILGQLTAESVSWVRQNLEVWDPATERLKSSARQAVIGRARELAASGQIALPGSAEGAGEDADRVAAASRDELASALAELVELAHDKGREALSAIVEEAFHPLLGHGLRCLLAGQDLAAIEKALDERVRALEAAYRAELEIVRQAVLAIARGEGPASFVERVGRG
jgi:hypothetical protein